jgi:hypothetical protein
MICLTAVSNIFYEADKAATNFDNLWIRRVPVVASNLTRTAASSFGSESTTIVGTSTRPATTRWMSWPRFRLVATEKGQTVQQK